MIKRQIIQTAMMRMRLMITMMRMIAMMILSASVLGSDTEVKPGDVINLAKRSLNFCKYLDIELTEIPSNISSDTQCLVVSETQIRVIPPRAFGALLHLEKLSIVGNDILESIGTYALANLPKLNIIYISGNLMLNSIGALAFSNLPELIEIEISRSKHLTHIHPDAFGGMAQLQFLSIVNTGLQSFPNLNKIHSGAYRFLLELEDNPYLERVPENAFRGLSTETITEIRLTRNGIKEVASGAFNGTKMYRLNLKRNKELTHIHPDAFVGSSRLETLDISHTALSSLPESILGSLKRLIAVSVPRLHELPPLHLFTKLREANLTYSSHCCAFRNIHMNKSGWPPFCSHPEVLADIYYYRDYCSNSTTIACTPTPDAFNPCEDIMATVSLRVLIWIISILALVGNTAVLLVLLGSRSKLTVPRFLMCHLAFADLCMGIYLFIIATVDTHTRGQYYNYARVWQEGPGCSAAGFFTVFASELSVFTLTAITLERWYTIRNALRLDRKLRLRHACVVMTAGWIFSIVAALLPTVGVSSYSKVSICLPMDVRSLKSQVYVVFLLLLNVLAFFCVCGCYLSIYLTVRNPSSAPAHDDTRVAQRMAVLIFTDFLCMAPLSFFAISAGFKLPLITVSHAKVLLVLFYPINSCSNPFLYAFFTHTFRQEFFLLTAHFGLFKTQAQIYRTESSACQRAGQTSPKRSHVELLSVRNAVSEIESKSQETKL